MAAKTKSLPIPWLLTPRYARVLSPRMVTSLPLINTNLLNKASWQSNNDKGRARSFMDALSSPRDAFILTTIARAAAATSDSSSSVKGVSISWKAAATTRPKSLISFLTSASEVFEMLFLSNGLPVRDRELSPIDYEIIHSEIIERFKDSTFPKFESQVKKKLVVKRARIVDTWSVWDSTNTPIDDLSSSGRLKVREIGRSANVEVSPTSSSVGGFFGFIQRTARTFFHFHGLQPLNRAVGQVTVAFVCGVTPPLVDNNVENKSTTSFSHRVTDDASDIKNTETPSSSIDSKSSSSSSSLTESEEKRKHLSNSSSDDDDEEVHTLTFEAQISTTASSSSFSLFRYLWGDRVVCTSGWRIVDIDGHFAAREGHTHLSFSPLLSRVRDITWRRAKLEMQECVDAVADEATFHAHVETLASRMVELTLALTAGVKSSAVGMNWWTNGSSERLGKRSISAAALPLQGILSHLKSAAGELADVQTNPPWAKRLTEEEEEENREGGGGGIGGGETKNSISETDYSKKVLGNKIKSDNVDDDDASDAKSASDSELLDKFLGKEGHIASLIAFTQLTPSAGWAVAAYAAIRHRVGKTMGELAGRRMDVEILYQVGVRGLIVLIEALMDHLEMQIEIHNKNEKTEKKDDSSADSSSTAASSSKSSNEKVFEKLTIDPSTEDSTLKSLLSAREAVEALTNLSILQDPSSMSMGVAVSSSQEVVSPTSSKDESSEQQADDDNDGVTSKKSKALSPQDKAKAAQVKLVDEIEKTSKTVLHLMTEMKTRGWLRGESEVS